MLTKTSPRPRRRLVGALSIASVLATLGACSSTTGGVQTGSVEGAASGQGRISTTAGDVDPGGGAPAPAPVTAWPLTGLPLPDPALASHSVVVVKIDDAPPARPQTGINQADTCFEERVEGITRLMCLFHSEDSDPVGPVRSARSSDIDLMGNMSRPLLLWSGGNPGVTAEIDGAAQLGFIVEASEPRNEGDYFRDNGRQIPHNLFTRTAPMRDRFNPSTDIPAPLFAFRGDGAPVSERAVDAAGIVVDFGGGVRVEYVWDAERLGWNRYQVDESHPRGRSAFVDTDGRQVAPQNVVILRVPYGASEADERSPKALTVGEGEAIVLTAGKAVYGHWSRPTPLAPWTITDDSGALIGLTPGRTWVALPDTAGVPPSILDGDAAGRLLGERR